MTLIRLYSILIATLIVLPLRAAVSLGFDSEENATVGIYIKDLRTGQIIAENDSRRAMVPASIMKCVTSASALLWLGADYNFNTEVFLSGHRNPDNITNWLGDLIIESCGDPTIDSENFRNTTTLSSRIRTALSNMNIKSISGSIVINQPQADQGCVPQWEIDDVGWAYGAGWYGFNCFDNKFLLYPATGKTSPKVPGLVVKTIKSNSGTDISRGINSDYIEVSGPDPTNKNWVVNASMWSPADVYINRLYEDLANAGIEIYDIDGSYGMQKTQVTTHTSPSLANIIIKMMHESHNLFAEGMLRALAPSDTREAALKAQSRLWNSRGVTTSNNRILDGSGLARGNRLQPIFLGNLLENMSADPKADSYIAAFPKVGMDGTVKSLLAESRLKGKLALKSGSMNGVQCYAGYKIDNSGKPTHVVVIMVNNFFCPRAKLRTAIENFLLKTFN